MQKETEKISELLEKIKKAELSYELLNEVKNDLKELGDINAQRYRPILDKFLTNMRNHAMTIADKVGYVTHELNHFMPPYPWDDISDIDKIDDETVIGPGSD